MLAFAFAVFLLIITPGPGVLSLAGVGTAYGWTHGIRYLTGLWIGNNLVSLAVISGLAALVLANPVIRTILLFASAAYLIYLAARVAFAGARIAFIHMAAPGVITGVSLQFINPKAYAVHTTLFSGFLIYPDNLVLETGLKLLVSNMVWIPLHVLWLYAGVRINELDLQPRTQRRINLIMAVCLVAVVVMSMWSILGS